MTGLQDTLDRILATAQAAQRIPSVSAAVFRDGEVVAEERLAPRVLGRIRSIAVDRAGLIYLGSDNGEVWRLSPD